MPKLQEHVLERNQQKIESAALRVFTRQGFHGTSMRDIADEAQVSIGNIYNYFPTKETLFVRLVARHEARIVALRDQALAPLRDVFDPASLHRFARAVREIVYDHSDYWRLMYIDIVEFGNQHFAHSFRHLAKNLAGRLGSRLKASTRSGRWNGVEPALAFTAIYLQFFTYFLVEKLFGGKQHLGVSDDRAVAQIIRIATEGLWRDGPAKKGRQPKEARP